ncbi:MAG TPA: hypothetical protein VEC35_20720 [Noviherbaspirillum sp.]|nr:hypothetical protein [Noviherbaspirillum sp.]
MKRLLAILSMSACVPACMITSEGARVSPPPPAVQGSNDAQGAPLSVPGAGMGVGAGNPAGPGPSGAGATSGR